MGNRLSKIYTRTGDDGTTMLASGERVSKDSLIVRVLGELDELSSSLGLLLVQELPVDVADSIVTIQHLLFDIGGQVSGAPYVAVSESDITFLEQQIDEWNAELPPLKEFLLPGGGSASAHCHMARVICRRVERSMIEWAAADKQLLCYINRLSDYLFVLCRVLSKAAGHAENLWHNVKSKSK